jgi:hypothetical protein
VIEGDSRGTADLATAAGPFEDPRACPLRGQRQPSGKPAAQEMPQHLAQGRLPLLLEYRPLKDRTPRLPDESCLLPAFG